MRDRREATRFADAEGVPEVTIDEGQGNTLGGWQLDDDTTRRITHRNATRAARARPTRFADAEGVPEVTIDAGQGNTLGGWRDVKMALISRRESAAPATPAEWETRTLPPPTIRTVVAAIEGAELFTTRVRTETDRLNVTAAAPISVLADGGEWVWHLASPVLPTAAGVLDICHALEHVSGAVRTLTVSATPAERLRATGTRALLSGGEVGIERWIGETGTSVPAGESTGGLLSLAADLANHPTHLDSAGRRHRGESIGSGQVEGAIKELVNLRLRRTGARGRVEHVGPRVELLALSDTPDWHHLWAAA